MNTMKRGPQNAVPSSIDALILPSASHNFSQTLSSIKRSRLSIKNRLRSIFEDSQFVQGFAVAACLPLIANERCGSWYIPTDEKIGSAYFKSTDGHQGQWKFSLRRLNLQVLDIVTKHDGCIIVDSTRSGKSMPDALSKTIPIWCAVWNRLLFPESTENHALYTPTGVVGRSEHAQIHERLTGFVESVKSLQLDVEAIQAKVDRPLRPYWITQTTPLEVPAPTSDHYRVMCCTASRLEGDGGVANDGYIQGAGDDSEGWSRGFTPAAFWRNPTLFLSTSFDEEHIPSILSYPSASEAETPSFSEAIPIYPSSGTQTIFISNLEALRILDVASFDAIITCDFQAVDTQSEAVEPFRAPSVLHLDCKTGKLGSRTLRNQLPGIRPFIEKVAAHAVQPRLLFACVSGQDLSVGMALATLCLYFTEDGVFRPQVVTEHITKDYIRRRLSWIMISKPNTNPARATLQSVNAFLMETPK